MLNKKLSVGSFLILTAICSPTFAEEDPTLSPNSAKHCIDTYDAIQHLQVQILDRDMQVSGEYSHFQVAQNNYETASTKRKEMELQLSVTDPTSKEYDVLTAQWSDLNEIVEEYDELRQVKLDSVQNVMYGRQLKAKRLKILRRKILSCRDRLFNIEEVTEICSTRTNSNWCEARF